MEGWTEHIKLVTTFPLLETAITKLKKKEKKNLFKTKNILILKLFYIKAMFCKGDDLSRPSRNL